MVSYYLILAMAVLTAKLSSLRSYIVKPQLILGTPDPTFAKRTSVFFDGLLIVVLVGFAGLRYGVGTDFRAYTRLYSHINIGDWSSTLQESATEIGYTLLSLVSKTIFDSPYAIFWVSSFLTVLLVILRLRKLDGSFALSIFLYITLSYYLAPFNIVRQGIALSLVFWAERYYDQNKIKFAVWMAVAACFHISVILFVVGYVIFRNLRPSVRLFVGSVFLSLAGIIVLRVVPGLGTALAFFNERYDDYLEVEGAGFGTYLTVIFRICVILYLLFLFSTTKNMKGHYVVLVIISLVFLLLGLENKLMARAEVYFSIFTIPAIVEALKFQKDKILHYYGVLLVGIIYMTAYISYYAGLLPYETQLGQL